MNKLQLLLTSGASFIIGTLLIWPIRYFFLSNPENYYGRDGWAISFEQWESMVVFNSLQQAIGNYSVAQIGFILVGLMATFLYINRLKYFKLFAILTTLPYLAISLLYVYGRETSIGCSFFGGGCGYGGILASTAFIISLIVSFSYISYSNKLKYSNNRNWKGGYYLAFLLTVYGVIFGVAGAGYGAPLVMGIGVTVLVGELIYFMRHLRTKTSDKTSSSIVY